MSDFRMLGPLEVHVDGRSLPLGGKRQRLLLAVLLLHANETVAADALIEALWGDHLPADPSNALHAAVSRLRRLLGAADVGGTILTRPAGYELRIEPEQLDWGRFQRLTEEGRRALAAANPKTASAKLSSALALWRGPVLADLGIEALAQESTAISEARIDTLELRTDAELALGRHHTLLPELAALVAAHPYVEGFRRQQMLALYRCGRQTEALEAFREARQRLVDELGIEPGPELQQVQQAILRHDPALAGPPARWPIRAARSSNRHKKLLVGAVAALLTAVITTFVVLETATGGRPLAAARDSVAVIDPVKGTLTADVPLPVRPDVVTAGLGGVWIGNRAHRLLIRIDPRRHRVAGILGIGVTPDAVSAGSDGVWAVDSTDDSLAHVDPRIDDSVTISRLPNGRPGSIMDGTAGLWVALQSYPSVLRIDRTTGKPVRKVDFQVGGIPGNGGKSTVLVAGGSVWVGNIGGTTELRMGDIFGFLTSAVAGPDGKHTIRLAEPPSALAYANGEVWAALRAENSVIAVDPSTGSIQTTLHVGRGPNGLAVGAGGVWVENDASRSVSLIDPISQHVVRTLRLVRTPIGIAVRGKQLWVILGER